MVISYLECNIPPTQSWQFDERRLGYARSGKEMITVHQHFKQNHNYKQHRILKKFHMLRRKLYVDIVNGSNHSETKKEKRGVDKLVI